MILDRAAIAYHHTIPYHFLIIAEASAGLPSFFSTVSFHQAMTSERKSEDAKLPSIFNRHNEGIPLRPNFVYI